MRRCQKRVNVSGWMLPPTLAVSVRYYDDYGLFLQAQVQKW